MGPQGTPALPALDAEGFLPANSKDEFIFKDEKDGLWYYISNNLYIEIRRYEEHKPIPEWYETRVRMRNGMAPSTIFSKNKVDSKQMINPAEIARTGKAVLAISDDAYTSRSNYNKNAGLIIRNGKALKDSPHRNPKISTFPALAVMAFLPDGGMAVYENGETTIRKMLAKGVQNSYSFGPILVQYGVETQTARYNPSQLHMGEHPRNAIGMYAKNDYLILTVNGRDNDTKGVSLGWVTDKFLEKGVKTAFNLDGGGTSVVIFMGEILNKTEKAARPVTSLICFGTSDKVKSK